MPRILLLTILGIFISSPSLLSAQTLDPIRFINAWDWTFDQEFDSGIDTSGTGVSTNGSAGEAGYSLAWDIAYGPATGPPEATVTTTITYSGGGASTLLGVAGVDVIFQIRVKQVAPPPVAVSAVPVHFQASGSANATGGDVTLYAESESSFRVGPEQSPLIFKIAYTDLSSVTSSAFTLNAIHNIAVGEVLECNMSAFANGAADAPSSSGTETAAAFVDPTITILDGTIPNTNQSYRDFFVVEFSPGYPDVTPVRRTTWGTVKRMYGPTPGNW